MSTGRRNFGRAIFVVYLLALHGLAGWLVFEKYLAPRIYSYSPGPAVEAPMAETPVPTPLDAPEVLSEMPPPDPSPENPQAGSTPMYAPQNDSLDLLIPVVGIRRDQLTDTFTQARSEGRVHEAIDIMAPVGTPVVACGDGEIVKFWDSERGGITIYQISTDGRYFYYYAHLQRRADNLKEHDKIARGTVIGYVGDTGNAGAGNYHLHFAIYQVVDPKRYWNGIPINPFPILQKAQELPAR